MKESINSNQDNKKKGFSSSVKRVAVAGLAAGGMFASSLNAAEPSPQKHHIRTNAEGRTAGFIRVPQDEQELADFVAQDAERFPPGSGIRQLTTLAYKALYLSQKNESAKLDQILTEYYKTEAKHPEVQSFSDLGEQCIDVLVEDGNLDTATETLKHIKDKKTKIRLATKISMAQQDSRKSKKH